jgi:hypothetical protein
LRTAALCMLGASVGAWLFAALAPAPAAAQEVCPANFVKTCPVDYAAKPCPATPLSVDTPRPPDLQSIDELMNVGEYKRKLTNYKCSGAYDKEVDTVLEKAIAYVEQHAADGKQPGGDGKQRAIVLDIDETSLSNWPAIMTDDYGFIVDGPCDMSIAGACGWRAWQLHAKDEAIAPTLKLFNIAKAKNVAIFFITGRCDDGHAKEATAANLRAAGYDGWTDLILRPKESCATKLETVADFKAPARAEIEQEGYTIIANVGDQWSDLNGGHSEQNFKVPNPFYFIK